MTDTTVNQDAPIRTDASGRIMGNITSNQGQPPAALAPQSPLAEGPFPQPPALPPKREFPPLEFPQHPAIPTQQKLGPAPDARKYQKGAMEWASAMAILGAVAGKFTRAPGGAALGAFAAALDGWRTGNLEAYQNAAKQWEQNTKAAIENNRQELEKYRMVIEDRNLSIDEQRTRIQLIAAEAHNDQMYNAMEQHNFGLGMKVYERNLEYTNKAEGAAAPFMQDIAKQEAYMKNLALNIMTGQINPQGNDPKTGQPWTPEQQAIFKYAIERFAPPIPKQPGGLFGGTPEQNQEALNRLGWNEKTIDAAARTFNVSGKLPTNLGTRQYAGMISGAIQNRAAELLTEEGKTPENRAKQWQRWHSEQLAISRFESGPQGNTIRSLNVAIDHLATMDELSNAMKNGNMRLFNQIAQAWALQNGKTAPTNLASAKVIVGPEIIKAIGVAGAGASGERVAAAETAWNKANSPDELLGASQTYRKLLAGQERGLKQQFMHSTGQDEQAFNSMLLPKTIEALKGLEHESASGGAAGAGEIPTEVDPKVWQHMTPEERALWE